MRIAVLNDLSLSEAQLARLRAVGPVIIHPDTIHPTQALARLKEIEVAIVDGFKLPITRPLLEGATDLRLLVLTSTAYHMVDFTAARESEIRIAHIPGYSTEAVAEHAIALLFAVVRAIPLADRAMRKNPFQIDPGNKAHRRFLGFELGGKTLGVIGLGAIGRKVADLGVGLGMNLLGCNRTPRSLPGVREVLLDELLAASDVVSLHLAVHPETENIISARELALMRPEAVLINTAGAELVDAAALYQALAERRIGGAALDVLSPKDQIDWLLDLDNVVLSPQSAAWTREACANLSEATVATVEAFMRGNPVNIVA